MKAYRRYDPAAKSLLEIFLFYPGIKALAFYRVAHFLNYYRVPLIPRFLTELGRFLTGIDIHPGASIGINLIIDHGMGVVIGETSDIGNHVIIYQGVTLGGTHLEAVKRHPTIEDYVVIGAGAKVLGNITVGAHSRIGANSVVISDVSSHSTVVGIPGRVIHKGVKSGEELCHEKIVDSLTSRT